MTKDEISRALNRWTGGEDELLCYRIYIQARIRGGFWIASEKMINVMFFVIRRERNHVKINWRWQEHQMKRLKGLRGIQLHESYDHYHSQEEKMDEKPRCSECFQPYPKEEAVVVKKHDDKGSFEITFCTEACATDFYIQRLREVEGG